MKHSDARALVLRTTRLQRPAFVPELRLHLADAIDPVWEAGARAARRELDDPPLPFWAFAWPGGLALARFLLDHPESVAGLRVVDLGTGSGLCAIAAARSGARSVVAADIDPIARAAATLNAEVNRVRVRVVTRDLLAEDPPDTDVIVAGDTWYEAPLAADVRSWLIEARARGTRVLVGDPGRAYLPRADLVPLADYVVPTSREIEDADVKRSAVYELPGHRGP